MERFRVHTERDCSDEFESLKDADEVYEEWKNSSLEQGVQANESFVELVRSVNGFEDHDVVKKVIAVIDHERMEKGSPREEGFQWDYWAKWQVVVDPCTCDGTLYVDTACKYCLEDMIRKGKSKIRDFEVKIITIECEIDEANYYIDLWNNGEHPAQDK